MSYSLTTSCHSCTKKDECTDRHFLAGAIHGIHQISTVKSHMGSGSITLDCNRLEIKAG